MNTLNSLPKVADKKYYYQIKIPKGDSNSLLIETIDSNEIKLALSKDNIQYPIIGAELKFYRYRYVINNNKEKDLYLNYYKTDYDYGYINFIDYKDPFNGYDIRLDNNKDPKVEQITGSNKIQVSFTSSSYYFYPDKFKYYIIINAIPNGDPNYYDSLYSIITNKKKIDKSKNEFMTIIEGDEGNNEFFECSIDIDIKVKDFNHIVIIPVRKDNNLVELYNIKRQQFYYSYNEPEETSIWVIIGFIFLCILGLVLIFFIILIVYTIFCKKKKSSIEDINEPIVKDNEELKTI